MEAKVLVANSSDKVRKHIVSSLSQFGVGQIVEAKDGKQALEHFQSEAYDIVFTEWSNMGTELAEEIRKRNDNLPIIMTASPSKTRQDLHNYCPEASEILPTSFKTEELRTKVEKYIPTLAG